LPAKSEVKAKKPETKISALASIIDYAGPMGDNDLSELVDENVQLGSRLRFNREDNKNHYHYYSKQRLAKLHPHKPSS